MALEVEKTPLGKNRSIAPASTSGGMEYCSQCGHPAAGGHGHYKDAAEAAQPSPAAGLAKAAPFKVK